MSQRESLSRWLRVTEQEKRALSDRRVVSGLARTGQVSRSTVMLAEEDVAVEDALSSGVDAEANNEMTDENLDLSDDATDAISDFQDDTDWMGEEEFESRADDSEEMIALYQNLAEAEDHLAEVEADINEKFGQYDTDIAEATTRINDAVQRVADAEAAVEQAQSDIQAAVDAAASAQVEASLAQGMLTISPNFPVAADGAGKKVGALWMQRTSTSVMALFEWTALGWVSRPLSEQIIPQVAIGTGTYGSLSGSRITTDEAFIRNLYASRVLVTGEDLAPGYGGYEAAWTLGPNGSAISSVDPTGWAVSVNVNNGPFESRFAFGPTVPVRPGDKIYANGYALSQLSANAAGQVLIQFSTDGRVWNSTSGNFQSVFLSTLAGWFEGTVTVPSGFTHARVAVGVSSGTTGRWVYRNFKIKKQAGGELLVDGAIASRHVSTGTLQAVAATITDAWIQSGHIINLDVSKLAVTGSAAISEAVVEKLYAEVVRAKLLTVTEKIITRDIIATGAISTDQLSATAIDGMTITGAIFRTAISGQRLQIDINGLRTFSTTGAETARLAAASGGLMLTGALVNRAGTTGPRASLTSGGIVFDNQDSLGSIEMDTRGIRRLGAGTPLDIGHDSAGTGSPLRLYASGSNKIEMMSEVQFASDTAWANVSIPGGSGVCRWRRYSGRIFVEFDIQYSSSVNSGAAISPAFTLPAAARPAIDTPINAQGHGTFSAEAYVVAYDTSPAGVCAIRNTHSGGVSRFKGNGSWFSL